VLVIHTPDGYTALSAICTHLGCIVFWNEQREVITCPCHEAYFSINGAVISGPPTAPLEEYRVQVEGDKIYVEGGEA
jgi:cytochrome b6-f complex iron-sulfur subunit